MSRPSTLTNKTLNWPAYNEALKRRGSLAIWFDPDMVWAAKPAGKRGRQPVYSDAAVQTCLTMKVLFGMALQQTTGFVESLLRLIGLDWDVPDFSTLSRRQKTVAVNIQYHRRSRVETKMHCVKLLGQRLMAWDFERQVAEFQAGVAVLNGFTALGIPVTKVAG
jgi:hypothetical protein